MDPEREGARRLRPPLDPPLTFVLNWARRTSWGWWDEWDDTALQTQNSEFDPWRSEGEQATSRSRRPPTILNHYEWLSGEETLRFFETWRPEWGSNPRSPTLQAVSFNRCTRVPPSKWIKAKNWNDVLILNDTTYKRTLTHICFNIHLGYLNSLQHFTIIIKESKYITIACK